MALPVASREAEVTVRGFPSISTVNADLSGIDVESECLVEEQINECGNGHLRPRQRWRGVSIPVTARQTRSYSIQMGTLEVQA